MFKPGELVVCTNITNKPFRGKKKKDTKWLTKGKMYTILENENPYNASITVICDIGLRKMYSPRRFRKFNRKEKLDKITKKIHDKYGQTVDL